MIKNHNKNAASGVHKYWLKMNQFGDMTNEEFAKMYNGYNQSLRMLGTEGRKIFSLDENVKVPDTIGKPS